MATAAQLKAERIAAEEEARIQAYQDALVAPALTQQQVDAINLGVQTVTESTGNVYNPDAALTVTTQASLNKNVETRNNFATGVRVDTTMSDKDKDAFALIKETFRLYDLEELFPVIEKLMKDDVGPEQAALLLKTDPRYNAAYVKRFAGNEARRKAGLNTMSEAEYLALEDSYTSTLKAYGLQSQFGLTREEKQAKMAGLIGGDISATEFKDRVDTVVTRVNNADPTIKETLRSFFDIKDADLVNYFINPTENLPKLQEKVTAAEIGAAAKGQDLKTSAEAATALAQYGITQAQARQGYETIGEILPTAEKLGSIYGEQYDQATAEAEVFKGTASARRKRQQLAEREVASFSGSSGRLRTGQQQGNTGQF